MTPARFGLLAGLFTSIGFFAIANVLDVTPERPIAMRTDVYFQSDAGGLVADAVANNNQRARGVHPAIYPLWTAPLHHLAQTLWPQVPLAVTATCGSRILVNLASGLGVGYLVFVLRKCGFSRAHLVLFLVLLVFAFGNTLAAIPDHFGISLGILAASYGVFLLPAAPRRRAIALFVLTIVAGSVTITNVVFPMMLLTGLAIREVSIPRWVWGSGFALALIGLAGAAAVWFNRPDLQARVEERVRLYLTWTLTREPLKAATMIARGVIDSVVGATPVVSSDSNLDRLPMLTFQPKGQPYPLWHYGWLSSLAAVAWLAILTVGLSRGLREKTWRLAIVLLLVWWAWNALFHTVWGDEYFLYTPHYAWALLTAALPGWATLPPRWLGWLTLPILAANARTLWNCRELLQSITI